MQMSKFRNLNILLIVILLGSILCAAQCDDIHELAAIRDGDTDGGTGDTENNDAGNIENDPTAPSGCQGVISIPDIYLEAEVRRILGGLDGSGLFSGDLRYADLKKITEIDFRDGPQLESVRNLDGVQCMTNLTRLILANGPYRTDEVSDITPVWGLTNLVELQVGISVTDLSPVANLKNLETLSAQGNITDLSPLVGLSRLTYLRIGDGGATDLTPLSGLTNLTDLHLWGMAYDPIIDISPLETLINLTVLDLYENAVSDLTPIFGMTKLLHLDMQENQVSDLTPLVDLAQAGGTLQTVRLTTNPVDCVAQTDNLLTLEKLDVVIESDCN
jgi:Leucine-rich repeat (LRR) protein